MAKRPPLGKCVHCLLDNVVRNWDHVLPESWYPDSTPIELEKWKIPSCLPCNTALGRIEEDLLIHVAMCLDPKNPGSKGLHSKVRAAIDPRRARGDRDRRAREKRAARLLANFNSAKESVVIHGVLGLYPGLVKPNNEQVANGIPLLISANWIKAICEKIVRGHVYLEDNRFIEPPFMVRFYALDDEGAKPIRDALAAHGRVFSRGDAIRLTRAKTEEQGFHALYEIVLWNQFGMFAVVTDDGAERRLDAKASSR